MTFEERMIQVRERVLATRAPEADGPTSPTWDDDMFKNGWSNCWGDFSNMMD